MKWTTTRGGIKRAVGPRPIDVDPRPGRPEKYAPCGTEAGYRKHRHRFVKYGEGVWPLPADDPCGCKAAHREHAREKARAA